MGRLGAVEESAGAARPDPDLLAGLFPGAAGTRLRPVIDVASPYAEERAQVEGAAPARRRAFFSGRRCAHEALAALGMDGTALPADPSRAPRWPSGVVGSIAHSSTLAGAVVARTSHAWGVGLDIESLGPALDPAVERLVLTERERSDGLQARVAFALKECVFKCLWPHTRWNLEFEDVGIRADVATGTWSAVVSGRFRYKSEPLAPLHGRLLLAHEHVLAGLWIDFPGPESIAEPRG